MDPDAPEEDEENEIDDVDGDQEETELLWEPTKTNRVFRARKLKLTFHRSSRVKNA